MILLNAVFLNNRNRLDKILAMLMLFVFIEGR